MPVLPKYMLPQDCPLVNHLFSFCYKNLNFFSAAQETSSLSCYFSFVWEGIDTGTRRNLEP